MGSWAGRKRGYKYNSLRKVPKQDKHKYPNGKSRNHDEIQPTPGIGNAENRAES